MALAAPPPLRTANPLGLMVRDLRAERAATVPFPPGETGLSASRTRRLLDDPLSLLLESYERFGPVFTLRVVYGNAVFMLGPAANHYLTVSHASNFLWRESLYRDMVPLVGDGLLTTDGDYHRRSRTIMLPALRRETVGVFFDVMTEETLHAMERLQPGDTVELCAWARKLALRISIRAFLGLDTEGEHPHGVDAARLSEQALSYYSSAYPLRLLRGPGSPWRRRQLACRGLDRLIYTEISRRRATGERGRDVLSLLMDARDEEDETFNDEQIRDQLMTLLFAGHDTTTSTLAFLFYELARHPEVTARIVAEQGTRLGGGPPTAAEMMSGELLELEMAMEETLRKYPPAWIGPRRSREPFEFEGHTVPGNALVNYCSWASHHLPEVFPDPSAFRPERFAPEARAALPKGAYLPFGGGSRTCIGMRFAQLAVRTITTLVLDRFTMELPPSFQLEVMQMPTITPKQGLPMIVRERASGSLGATRH